MIGQRVSNSLYAFIVCSLQVTRLRSQQGEQMNWNAERFRKFFKSCNARSPFPHFDQGDVAGVSACQESEVLLV